MASYSYKSYILLLEWRAALLVREIFLHQKEADTNPDQRVAKAVTEAFVARQVGEMIENLDSDALGVRDRAVLRDLYTLVTLSSSLHCSVINTLPVSADDHRKLISRPALPRSDRGEHRGSNDQGSNRGVVPGVAARSYRAD